MASSSASLPLSLAAVEWKYDVFLSFRGPDTRKGITSDLHRRLESRGVKTFMDNQDLEVGDAITPALLTAIKESRFAIIVLSENYASSAWCLEELEEICQSMKDDKILPLFYDVDPTNVRYQKESFEKAFSKHETSGRHDSEKMMQWRASLTKVGNISGWNTNAYKTHQEMIDSIVETVCHKVFPNACEPMGELQEFRATRQAMDEVMAALKDDQVNAVGVYGMGGVGKTTMVDHVGAQARKEGLFVHVVMVVVSQNPDFEKIQDTLAEKLGFKLSEKTESGRSDRLNKEIMSKEKLLLILDDVWGRIELSKIRIPRYTELQKCKSKVLLTTRRLNVCHTMECQATINLTTLSEEDAWTLFLKKANKSFQKSTEFYKVARKVARECAGLPVALIAVARAVGDKDFKDWKEAARRLEMSQSSNLDEEKDVFDCIKLSYDYLDSNDAKSCFLLCCLFPEDYDIKIEDLMKYGFGTRLFRDANGTIENARAMANSVAKYLKASCLLLDSTKKGCVRMHDVIRDMAISIAFSEDGHASLVKTSRHLNDWSLDAPEGYSAISLMESNICKLPNKLVCSKLQILLLQRNVGIREIPETFFPSPNDIRVLDLRETRISSLPPSLSLLTRLQALHLDHCKFITDLSMLGELKNLEILSMRGCSIKKFPKEIGNLTNLRMLDLNQTKLETLPPRVISRLSRLEELYMDNYFGDWGIEVDEGCLLCFPYKNAGFDEVTGLLKLRLLKVCISDEECIPKIVEDNPNWVEFNICMGKDTMGLDDFDQYGQTVISLYLATISNFPEWFFKAVMNRAERLEWKCCPSLIDMFVEYEHGRFHELKHLSLDGVKVPISTLAWVREKPVFKNLVELHLQQVDCVELCVGELPRESLINLKLLNVRSCYNWGNVILPSTLLQRLSNLEELYCKSMEGIDYVFGYKVCIEPKDSKLRKIELFDLTVRSLYDGPAPLAIFRTLQSLSVDFGNLQGSLFTRDVARCLDQLKELCLHHCPILERIVEATNKKIILPKLEKLVLSVLPMLYYESATFDIECPSLEHLYVKECPKFLVSVSDFHSRNQVQLHED